MALKLRRRVKTFTNGNLSPRSSGCSAESLGTGAGSFKRVLGGGRPETLNDDQLEDLGEISNGLTAHLSVETSIVK